MGEGAHTAGVGLRLTGQQPRPRLRGRGAPRHVRSPECGRHQVGRRRRRRRTGRRPVELDVGGMGLAVVAFTDHPAEYAAGPDHPGVAYADLRHGAPDWLRDTVRAAAADTDAVLVTPHWGPNFRLSPLPPVTVRLTARVPRRGHDWRRARSPGRWHPWTTRSRDDRWPDGTVSEWCAGSR